MIHLDTNYRIRLPMKAAAVALVVADALKTPRARDNFRVRFPDLGPQCSGGLLRGRRRSIFRP